MHTLISSFCHRCLMLLFFLHYSDTHRNLHSFPTRRSSDLQTACGKKCGPKTLWHALAVTSSSFCWRNPNSSPPKRARRSEEHTSELQSRFDLVCRLLLEKKKKTKIITINIHSAKLY